MSNNTIKFMYYLYDYDTGELIDEFEDEQEYYKTWDKWEKRGRACFGQDTNSLLHNWAVDQYRLGRDYWAHHEEGDK